MRQLPHLVLFPGSHQPELLLSITFAPTDLAMAGGDKLQGPRNERLDWSSRATITPPPCPIDNTALAGYRSANHTLVVVYGVGEDRTKKSVADDLPRSSLSADHRIPYIFVIGHHPSTMSPAARRWSMLDGATLVSSLRWRKKRISQGKRSLHILRHHRTPSDSLNDQIF